MYPDLLIWAEELHLKIIKIMVKNHFKYAGNKLRLGYLKE